MKWFRKTQPPTTPKASVPRYAVETLLTLEDETPVWTPCYTGNGTNSPAGYAHGADAVKRMDELARRWRGRLYRVVDTDTSQVIAQNQRPMDWGYRG